MPKTADVKSAGGDMVVQRRNRPTAALNNTPNYSNNGDKVVTRKKHATEESGSNRVKSKRRGFYSEEAFKAQTVVAESKPARHKRSAVNMVENEHTPLLSEQRSIQQRIVGHASRLEDQAQHLLSESENLSEEAKMFKKVSRKKVAVSAASRNGSPRKAACWRRLCCCCSRRKEDQDGHDDLGT